MPLQATSGAASYDAFGGGVSVVPAYIEDVFSTYLYTANGSTQTITNGIDLSTKGGLVWIKARNTADTFNCLFDTNRGATKALFSNVAFAQGTYADSLTSFNTNGFSLGADGTTNFVNFPSGQTEVSWTFRKQPKFFDVVTWTGNGSGDRAISHSLASTPGCILLKRLDGGADDWSVYHTSLGTSQALRLNTTEAVNTATAVTAVSSSTFTVNSGNNWNYSGLTYVAYLFAHNAGGFGLTGTDNVISCGSYTGNGSANGPVVNLGYEPQWVLTKGASTNANYAWQIVDNMRGIPMSGNTQALFPNTSGAESAWQLNGMQLSATGFQITAPYAGVNASGETYIYIAIRRGPMKVPTSGTSVFDAAVGSGYAATGVGRIYDLAFAKTTTDSTYGFTWVDRLRGLKLSSAYPQTPTLFSSNTDAEDTTTYPWPSGLLNANGGFTLSGPGGTKVQYLFGRAPSFFDEVCYTGVDSGDLTLNHNLSVPYEMLVIKRRSGVGNWFVLHSGLTDATKYIRLNTTNGQLNAGVTVRDSTNTTFLAPSGLDVTVSGSTYVAYLFATCAGVSKVGSYTGNGTTQTIDCGFTGGARFVLIKRTDSTSGWYVYDTARGMTVLTDPYLFLNNTDAESATLGSVTTVSTGFALNSSILAAINVSGGTYIFLAIA